MLLLETTEAVEARARLSERRVAKAYSSDESSKVNSAVCGLMVRPVASCASTAMSWDSNELTDAGRSILCLFGLFLALH